MLDSWRPETYNIFFGTPVHPVLKTTESLRRPHTRERVDCKHSIIINSGQLEQAQQWVLDRALELQPKNQKSRLLAAEPEYSGFEWYDQLPRATRMRTHYSDQSGWHAIDALHDKKPNPRRTRVDIITITLTVTDNRGKNQREIVLYTDIGFSTVDRTEHRYDCTDLARNHVALVVQKDSDATTETVATLLQFGYFGGFDELYAHSWDEMYDRYTDACYETASQVIESSSDAEKPRSLV